MALLSIFAATILTLGNILTVLLFCISIFISIIVGDKLASNKTKAELKNKASIEMVEKTERRNKEYIDDKMNQHEKIHTEQNKRLEDMYNMVQKIYEKII